MNYHQSSYCFETGSGGINVELEKQKGIEDVRFSIEDIEKPIALVELDGSVSKVNEQFMNLFGAEKKKNIDEVISGKSLDIWKTYLRDIPKNRNMTVIIQVFLKRFQLSEIKVNLFFDPIEKKVLILFNTASSLEIDKGKYSSMAFRKSDNLMIIANLDWYIEDVNDLTDDFFDLPIDYFIGKRVDEVFSLFTSDLSTFDKFKKKVIAEGHAEMIEQYMHSSEDIRYYKFTAFFDEDSNSFVMRLTDCTAKEKLKRDLEAKDSLSEVGQLAASIAHEIRNPMTTLKGFTQLLKATATEETLKYLTVIDDEIIRMESILSEMLFLAKPNVNEKRNISAKKILLDIINVIKPKATFEGITIVKLVDCQTETLIYGDEGKLKQVLLNLLKNALESMNPGGTLKITLEDAEVDYLKIIIEDTGKGMDVNQLNQIFSPYFTTRADGTGLGLPFVIKTVEDHGGTISVNSKVNMGSIFTLSFPLVKGKQVKEKELAESV